MNFFRIFCIGLCMAAATSEVGHAWWDTAHMLTVEIAKSQLPDAVQMKMEEIVSYFDEDFPRCGTLTTASCFPDDITTVGLSGFKVWHGVLTPYDPEGILTGREREIVKTLVSTNNLHSAICQALSTLKSSQAGRWEKAFMLCFLLHSVGDIHQPLHCVQMYSSRFPEGDLAGHRFCLRHSKFKNLHALWDAMLGLGDARLQRPLDAMSQAWLATFAMSIVEKYPPEALPHRLDMKVENWSRESFDLATAYVYEGIEPEIEPSEEYMTRGREVAQRQIALAGYRLAHLLNELYSEL